jgi:hypothetical protein
VLGAGDVPSAECAGDVTSAGCAGDVQKIHAPHPFRASCARTH